MKTLLDARPAARRLPDGHRPDPGARIWTASPVLSERAGHRAAAVATRSRRTAISSCSTAISRPEGRGREDHRQGRPERFDGPRARVRGRGDAPPPRSSPARVQRRRRRRHPLRGAARRPGHARDAQPDRAPSWGAGSATRSRSSPTGASPAAATASSSDIFRRRPPSADRSACCKSGDRIVIDARRRELRVLLPAAELRRRRAAWKPAKPFAVSGALAKYAHLVGSASLGAVTEPIQARPRNS